ncbi:MAG: sigma-70 family RNA polymerase sigma factor [Aureliella sp.]
MDVYSPLIYGYCRKRNVQSQDAADVTQEVLIRVNRAIATFEYSREHGMFRDWLAKIVSNELARFWGKQGDVKPLDHASGAVDNQLWQENFHEHILAAALLRTEPHFESQTWRLFTESWIEKKSAAAIAAEQRTEVDQVYVAKSRVLKRLKHEVNALAEDSP